MHLNASLSPSKSASVLKHTIKSIYICADQEPCIQAPTQNNTPLVNVICIIHVPM